jgi:hypothetical protein
MWTSPFSGAVSEGALVQVFTPDTGCRMEYRPTHLISAHFVARLVRTLYIRSTGILVLAMMLLSLVWCGEGSCLRGHNDDDCSGLLCALANKTTSATPTSPLHTSQSCCAVGHTTALPIQSGDPMIVNSTGISTGLPLNAIADPPHRTLLRPPSVYRTLNSRA